MNASNYLKTNSKFSEFERKPNVNSDNMSNVYEEEKVMFPLSKKGELTDVDGYYVMQERDPPSEQ